MADDHMAEDGTAGEVMGEGGTVEDAMATSVAMPEDTVRGTVMGATATTALEDTAVMATTRGMLGIPAIMDTVVITITTEAMMLGLQSAQASWAQ